MRIEAVSIVMRCAPGTNLYLRATVLYLAGAVILGAAFNKIVTSLTEFPFRPLIGKIFGDWTCRAISSFDQKILLMREILSDIQASL
jgi:large-conductance mechanosensitive channel